MNRTRALVWLSACALAAAGPGCGRTMPYANPALGSISVDRPTGAVADGVDAVRIRVTVRDSQGNPVPGVVVALDATGTGNALTQPDAPTDADGLATGSLSTTVAELKIISATIDQGTLTATASARFSPGPAARLVFAQQPTDAEATTLLAPPVTVAVQDQHGNAVTSWAAPISLGLSARSGAGNLSGATSVPPVNGLATFSSLSVGAAGQYRLVATSGTLAAATSNAFTIRELAVTGTRFIHWVNDRGVVDQPQDLRNAFIGAWVPRDTGFGFYAGIGAADGTFKISGVPIGASYWLCFKTDCFATSERVVDLGFHLQGRPSGLLASSGTRQHTVLTGMVPWTDDATFLVSDDLQMFSSNVGLWVSGLQYDSVAGDIASGATSLDQTYDYALIAQSGYTPALADAVAGDRTYFTQLTTRDAGFVLDGAGTRQRWNTYQAVERVFGPAPLTVANGAATSVSGAFTPVAQDKAVPVSWLISAGTPGSFGSYRTAVNPRAWTALVTHLMAIDAIPDSTHGFYASTPDLAVMILEDDSSVPQPDQRLNVVYGDPYPASWGRLGVAQTTFIVPYRVTRSGAGAGTADINEFPILMVNDLLPSFPSTALKPRVSPVTGATIDGAPFFNDQRLAGDTPVIRWNLPAVGTPTYYTVWIRRFSAGSTGPATAASVVRFATTATQLTVPPGFLVSGYQYVVHINAIVEGGHDIARVPYEQQWPFDSAPALSGLLTMP